MSKSMGRQVQCIIGVILALTSCNPSDNTRNNVVQDRRAEMRAAIRQNRAAIFGDSLLDSTSQAARKQDLLDRKKQPAGKEHADASKLSGDEELLERLAHLAQSEKPTVQAARKQDLLDRKKQPAGKEHADASKLSGDEELLERLAHLAQSEKPTAAKKTSEKPSLFSGWSVLVVIGLLLLAVFWAGLFSPNPNLVTKALGMENTGREQRKTGIPSKAVVVSSSRSPSAIDINVDFTEVEEASKSGLKTWKDKREQGRKREGIEERMKTRELALEALDQELEGTKKIKELWKERGEVENLPPKERELYEAELDQRIAEAQAVFTEAQARKTQAQKTIDDLQKGSTPSRQQEREEEEAERQHKLNLAKIEAETRKYETSPDPLTDYRQKKTEEAEKKKIDMEVEQEVKKAQREAESTQESEMETDLRKARNEGYPEAWESEGKWLENLETRRDKLAYVDMIIETYEQKKQRILQKYGVK